MRRRPRLRLCPVTVCPLAGVSACAFALACSRHGCLRRQHLRLGWLSMGGNHVPGASCELDCSWSFVFRARAWLVQLRCARAAGSHQHCVRDCLFFRCPRLLPVVHVCPSRCASGVAPRAPCTLMRLPRRRLRLGALARDGPSVGLRARLTCALCVCPGLAWAVCA